MAQRGSALMVVISCITFISLIYLCVIRSSNFSYQISLARLEKKRTFYALRALVDYGVAQCISNYQELCALYKKGTQEWVLSDNWPLQGSITVPAQVNITIEAVDRISLLASLAGTRSRIRCVLSIAKREEDFYWAISEWQEM